MIRDHVALPETWLEEDTALVDGAASARALPGGETSIRYDVIGRSEEGRPIRALTAGNGPRRMSLIAGAHADEPAGPTTLRALVAAILTRSGAFSELFREWTLHIVPHVNPDGEARNAAWRDAWPNVEAYLRRVIREKPGRDVEFGYPDMRPENRVVAAYLRANGPFHGHASLHGMGFSDGAMLLIDKHWGYRTEHLQHVFVRAAAEHGLELHDHNRKGEKGFFRIAQGFTTTPEGAAMRTWFRSRGDEPSALLFRDSSMEYVRSLGGDPLCVVTELPLFLIEGPRDPELPTSYLAFRERLPEIRLGLEKGWDMAALWQEFGLAPVPVRAAVDIHLRVIEAMTAYPNSNRTT